MRKNQRNFLALVGVVMFMICCLTALKLFYLDKITDTHGQIIQGQEDPQKLPEEESPEVEKPAQKVYVNVFFIGQNANKEELYRAVKRQYDEEVDGSKIKFAIKSLVAGPVTTERNRGVYSEIPSGTEVIYVQDLPDKVIVNLNSRFETGGGADSLYKRVYQLIKTAKNNTTKPVYLYIEGRKVDVLGGEGLMLTQPLNENSLDG